MIFLLSYLLKIRNLKLVIWFVFSVQVILEYNFFDCRERWKGTEPADKHDEQ
jgi:hypothetical protein